MFQLNVYQHLRMRRRRSWNECSPVLSESSVTAKYTKNDLDRGTEGAVRAQWMKILSSPPPGLWVAGSRHARRWVRGQSTGWAASLHFAPKRASGRQIQALLAELAERVDPAVREWRGATASITLPSPPPAIISIFMPVRKPIAAQLRDYHNRQSAILIIINCDLRTEADMWIN